MRVAPLIELSPEENQRLKRIASSRTVRVREARRAAIVMLAAEGLSNQQIAERLGVGRVQVGRWRTRYAAGGWAAMGQDRPRGGRPRQVDAEEIVRLSTQTKPPGATHGSTRTLAEATGVSASSIRRVWQTHGLKPHRVETFEVSRGSAFSRKA